MTFRGRPVPLEKWTLLAFLFFLLFSNLISRMIGVNVNILVYLSFIAAFALAVFSVRLNALVSAMVILAMFCTAYVFDVRYQLKANIGSIRDTVIPLLCVALGYRIAHFRKQLLPALNRLCLVFIGYGVLQEIAFYSGSFGSILPWDQDWIDKCINDEGFVNIFQGPLLRFFGTMNSFSEYQIYIAVIMGFLLLNRLEIGGGVLLAVNIALALVFLGMSFERSPLAMAAIIIFVWKFKSLLKAAQRLAWVGAAVAVVSSAVLVFDIGEIRENPKFGEAVQRMENLAKMVVSMEFDQDGAVKDRMDRGWKHGVEMARDRLFGIGPGRVTPGGTKFEGYLAPHNNYLVFYLGYGIMGLLLFLLLLFVFVFKISDLPVSPRHFGYGLVASYCAMSVFNVPFANKPGILFFLIAGYLDGLRWDATRDARTAGAAVSVIDKEEPARC